jgi:hypothetical protein
MDMTENPHYVTPEEAKDMCCPISMMGNPHLVWKSCLGKRCMIWRWDKNAPIRYKGDGNPQPTEQAKGYCGMVRT